MIPDSGHYAMKTYRTRNRIVATVKKSMDTNCPT
jgi:hypothetical protein